MTSEPRQPGRARAPGSYGWAARIGLIVPSTNTVNEAEWQLLLRELDGVSVHVTRMTLHLDTSSVEGRAALEADLAAAIGSLQAAGMGVIAYGCTAGSLVSPLDSLTDRMQHMAGVPCAATASALVLAARALGLGKVAVATPYCERLNRHEAQFLQSNGLEVVNIRGLGIGAGGPQEYAEISRVPESEVFDHALSTWRDEADGMIISCTDFPTLRSIAALEERLGKPVISSNTATLWQSLRLAGVSQRLAGGGRLLAAP